MRLANAFLKLAILMLVFNLTSVATFAQSADPVTDCDQFTEALNDARNGFKKYLGENSVIGYDGTITGYNYNFWGSTSAEHVEDYMWGGVNVDFKYGNFKSLAEARKLYNSLLKSVTECLPSSFSLVSEKDSENAVFKQFANENDSDEPIISVMIATFGQTYDVKISFAK
jgi:hypothetical protein